MTEATQQRPQLLVNNFIDGLVYRYSSELTEYYKKFTGFLELGKDHPFFKVIPFKKPSNEPLSMDLNLPTPLKYLWWYQNDPVVPTELKKIITHVSPYEDDFFDSLRESDKAVLHSRLERAVLDFEGSLRLQPTKEYVVVEGENIDSAKIFGVYVHLGIAPNGNNGHLIAHRIGVYGKYWKQTDGLSTVKADVSVHIREDPKHHMNYINGGFQDDKFKPERVGKFELFPKTAPNPIRLMDFGSLYLRERQQFTERMNSKK